MKRTSKTFSILAIALYAALLLSGCASGPVAAEVAGEKITVKELQNYYDTNAAYAIYYGYDLSTDEGVDTFVEYLLDMMIREKLLAYEARDAGVTLTEEEQAEVEKAAAEAYDAMYQQYVSYATSAGAANPTVYANEMLTDTLVQNGSNIQKLKKEYLDSETANKLVEKHKAQLLEGVTPTAEELEALYETELESQKTLFETTPSSYFTYSTSYGYGSSYMPLFVPEGFFRVRQILVEDEETANTVLERIDAGEDFETLLKEYNTDPGMDSAENADGYLVGEGASFVEEFLNAALALTEDGQVSPVVQSSYGYHILKRTRAEESREIPYAEVQADFDRMAAGNAETEHYEGIVTGWMDSDAVTRYPEAYASVGKAS